MDDGAPRHCTYPRSSFGNGMERRCPLKDLDHGDTGFDLVRPRFLGLPVTSHRVDGEVVSELFLKYGRFHPISLGSPERQRSM
jgi:hypothetical protein